MSVEFVNVHWFCAGHGNVGVVKVNDPYEGIKYYIGQCKGVDAIADINHIMNWGSTFPKDAGDKLFEL